MNGVVNEWKVEGAAEKHEGHGDPGGVAAHVFMAACELEQIINKNEDHPAFAQMVFPF